MEMVWTQQEAWEHLSNVANVKLLPIPNSPENTTQTLKNPNTQTIQPKRTTIVNRKERNREQWQTVIRAFRPAYRELPQSA